MYTLYFTYSCVFPVLYISLIPSTPSILHMLFHLLHCVPLLHLLSLFQYYPIFHMHPLVNLYLVIHIYPLIHQLPFDPKFHILPKYHLDPKTTNKLCSTYFFFILPHLNCWSKEPKIYRMLPSNK